MLGRLDPSVKEVTIVGAGFAGMLAAYELDRRGYLVELFEEGDRAGGVLGTHHTSLGLVERAAQSFLLTPALARICKDVGVELVPVRPDSRARFVLRRGKMRRFPLSLLETFTLFARVVFRRARVEECGMTLGEWGRKHLGVGATENLLAPFLRGIFASPPDELSLSAVFPQLAVPPKRTLLGTVWRARRARIGRGEARALMHTPREGMGALVGALERRLEARLGSRFRRGTSVQKLPQVPNLILALPAYRAAALLVEDSPELSRRLSEVEYSPLVSATLFARREQFGRVPRGVGVLASPGESSRVLGILFNSSAFEGRVAESEGLVSLTAMLGGAADPDALALSDAAIEGEILDTLRRLFDFLGGIEHLEITRWPRAIPKYSSSLEKTWAVALEGWCAHPGHVLFGNYTGQVSLRGLVESAATRFDNG